MRKAKIIKAMKKCFILLLFFFLYGCTETTVTKNTEYEYRVKFVAAGDNLIHNTIYEACREQGGYDFRSIYAEIKTYIKNYDLAFINQETILGGTELGLSTYPNFNSPQEVGDALIDAGFNLFSLANNHTLDRGEVAIVNAVNYFENKDVYYSGARISLGTHLSTFKINNIKFAFIAYTYGTNGIRIPKGKEYLVNVYSHEKARQDLESLEGVDFVIVSMHWGDEYTIEPNKYQIEVKNFLSSLGVDLIVGHHPHILQPVEEIVDENNKTFVAYSLGNFLSDQQGIDRLIGGLLSLEFVKKKNGAEKMCYMENYEMMLTYRYKKDNVFSVMPLAYVGSEKLDNYLEVFMEKVEVVKTYYDPIQVR